MRMELKLNGNDYADAKALHKAIAEKLNFEEYYGANADALYDMLSERQGVFPVIISGMGQENVAAEMRRCIRVLKDLGYPVTLRGSAVFGK